MYAADRSSYQRRRDGETALTAIRREVLEEVGVTLQVEGSRRLLTYS